MSRAPVHLPVRSEVARRDFSALARGLAVVSLAFCVVVASVMIVDFLRDRDGNPLLVTDADPLRAGDPLVLALRRLNADLANRPDDATIKQQLRDADREIRARHLARQERRARGGWLLVAGMTVLLLSLKAGTQLRPVAPGVMTHFPPAGDPLRAATLARRGVLGVAGILVAVALLLPLRLGNGLPEPTARVQHGDAIADASTASIPLPSRDEWSRQWPVFRGPSGCGLVNPKGGWPADWDGTTDRNVRWKVPVPLPGQNSPIVWQDRVFVSGATSTTQEVFCFAADDGRLLWRRPVRGPVPGTSLKLDADTGFAAPTMATDGVRVYAVFPTGDLAAFTLDGKPLWSRNLGKPDSLYGYASSLATHDGRVLVQFDQGHSGDERRSALLAIDGATGKTVWRVPRPVPASWSSPVVLDTPRGPQLVLNGKPWVISYHPDDGTELWRAEVLDGDVAASAAIADGTIYVANDQARLSALASDGSGDVTATHVKWSAEDGMPDICSPLAGDGFVLLLQSTGTATCYDAQTGELRWQHDFDAPFHASPVLVGSTVYLVDRAGVTHLLEAGAEPRVLATLPLGEPVSASPAFANGRIYLRGKEHLFCIGTP